MSKSDFYNERWGIPDQTAAFLLVDRDVCRRAFHGEPAYRVAEAVQWVLSRRRAPDYDAEGLIEGWAREHGAGLYAENRPREDFVRAEAVVLDALPGLEEAERPDLDYAVEYLLYLELVRAREKRAGRELLPSELERFTRKFYASSHRKGSRQLTTEDRAGPASGKLTAES